MTGAENSGNVGLGAAQSAVSWGNQPIMEKLKSIRITGFRSFRDVVVELGDINVLIGANGSGKSNFIGFFRMLNSILSERLQLYVGRGGGGSSILHYGPKHTQLVQAHFEIASDWGSTEYNFALTFASPDNFVFADEHVLSHSSADSTSDALNLGTGHLETKLWSMTKWPDPFATSSMERSNLPVLRGIQVYHFHDTSQTASIRLLQDVAQNRELLKDGGNLAAFLYMLQQTRPKHFDRILRTIQLVIPYLHKLILEPERLNPQKILLRWSDKSSDYEFGPHQLSDGSLRAIAMITALLQPEELLPSVIIMDEPELGLHPSAIEIVASLVRQVSSKRQVIVATQSPGLISHFSPDEVIVVERNDDKHGFGESQCKRLSSDSLAAWLEDYNLGELYEKNVTGGWPK